MASSSEVFPTLFFPEIILTVRRSLTSKLSKHLKFLIEMLVIIFRSRGGPALYLRALYWGGCWHIYLRDNAYIRPEFGALGSILCCLGVARIRRSYRGNLALDWNND